MENEISVQVESIVVHDREIPTVVRFTPTENITRDIIEKSPLPDDAHVVPKSINYNGDLGAEIVCEVNSENTDIGGYSFDYPIEDVIKLEKSGIED